MTQRSQLIYTDNPGSLPATFVIPDTLDLVLQSVTARFNGAAAAGDFKPCLSLYSSDGRLIGRFAPSTELVTGDEAVVTYAPFLGGDGGGSGRPGIVLIYDSGVLTASQTNFDFDNIPQSYSHLWMVASLRNDGAVTGSHGRLTFNGDTGANYEDSQLEQSGGVVGAGNANGLTAMKAFDALGASAEAGHYASNQVIVYDYAYLINDHVCHGTNFHTGVAATLSTYYSSLRGGQYCPGSNHTITRLTLSPGHGSNWVAGSSLRIYGMP